MTVPFTQIALMAFGLGCIAGHASHIWAVSSCLLWGTAAAFHVAPLLDNTVYHRMREKCNWSMAEFHAGNLLLHVFPLGIVLWYPATGMRWIHGLSACLIHIAWTVSANAHVDQIYVPLPAHHWRILFAIGWMVELAVPGVMALGSCN